MHICLIAPNDGLNDPRARVSRHLLLKAGHQLTFVSVGEGKHSHRDVVLVHPTPANPAKRLAARRHNRAQRAERLTQVLAQAAIRSGAELYIPTDPRALDAAIAAAQANGGLVSRTPKMRSAGDLDLIDVAPGKPETSAPVSGLGMFHTPADHRSPYKPELGRHQHRSVVLCYRKSEVNPGRYLEAALARSGVRLRVETVGIDLSSVDPGTDLVLFVEGPYPALEVERKTDVPVLFWFHHGEHHLHANLRLADRYQADAVLMAHSWHLAYWLPTPVHRFPFGVATELLDPGKPLSDRRYDVAMVGAGLRSGGHYGRRQQLVAELDSAFPPERLGFREQVSAPEMAALYGNSRIVINEGGRRHYPITMRVLEAVGSGAVLLSDRIPGMEVLLEPGTQYAVLSDEPARDVAALLDDPERMRAMAESALDTAMGLHTYDHRVDELLSIAERTEKRSIPPPESRSQLAEVIDNDVEVQRVAQRNAPELTDQLPDREVWDAERLAPHRLAPGKMESVAIRSETVVGMEPLLRAARRFAYIDGDGDGLGNFLDSEAPQAVAARHGGVVRVDFRALSYRIMDFEETS